jgi:hypothetical protein
LHGIVWSNINVRFAIGAIWRISVLWCIISQTRSIIIAGIFVAKKWYREKEFRVIRGSSVS